MDETVGFYERLGFGVVNLYRDFGPAYLIVRRDDVELHFVHTPEVDPRGTNGACYLRLVDAQAVYDEWSPLELPEVHPPRDTPWGMREFFVVDPSGNLLRIGTPLSPRP
jgi:catechol 2,3-dioxygenase-like lactoylglutathione lyase family enzyme